MHPCLDIPEIRLALARSLQEGLEWRRYYGENSRTLVALALTCRAFQEPALNALWELQSSLSPLVRVMPDDLWSFEDGQTKDIVCFTRHLTENDWDRFDAYSAKIRTLHLSTGDTFGVDETLLRQLSTFRPTRHLLPRLRTLILIVAGEDTYYPCIEYLPIFLGKSLTELRIEAEDYLGPDSISDFDEPLYSVEDLLSSAKRICPNLHTLIIPYLIPRPVDDPREAFALESFLCGFKNIRYLGFSLQNATPSIMRKIGKLPNLSRLDIGNVPYSSWASLHSASEHPVSSFTAASFSDTFRGLISLEACNFGANDLKTTLNHAPITLQSFHAYSSYGSVHLKELVDPLQRFTDLTSLLLRYDEFDFHSVKQGSALLAPILSLRNLRNARLMVFPTKLLTDVLLCRISDAWPRLESLELKPRCERKTQMTLKGLVPISQKCMALTELDIIVLARPFRTEEIEFGGRVSVLQRLDLDSSPVEEPLEVLRCIQILFPRLWEAHAWEAGLGDALQEVYSWPY